MIKNTEKMKKLINGCDKMMDKFVKTYVTDFEALGSASTRDYKMFKRMVALWKEAKEVSLSITEQYDEQSEVLKQISMKLDRIEEDLKDKK